MSKSETSSRTNRVMGLVPAAVLFGMALALGACVGPEPVQTTTTERTTIQQPMPAPVTTTTTRTQQYTP